MSPDLERIMQRFVRKPVRVSLSTLLGVYRAVMRLMSVTDALYDAIEDDGAEADESGYRQLSEEAGERLIRRRIIGPLQKVGNYSG